MRNVGLLRGRVLGDAGDALSQEWIARVLQQHRPDDAVLSEEAADNRDRLVNSRVWIIDPLDGTREFAGGRQDWAVHIALIEDGTPVHAAVGLPDLGQVFHTGEAKAVTGFELELDGITILDFEGFVLPWRTYHGPSGASLIGEGRVRIAPQGDFASGFAEAMGRSELHYGAADMWIRFPLATWEKIEPQLRGAATHEDMHEIKHKNRRIHTFSFSTYFFEERRAQIPPPGSSLVIFTTKGKERLGFVREPLRDGRVHATLWDHLHQDTLWEETH